MALTAKQEAFAQAIVSGKSQADAYRGAYDAGRMKPATIQNNASSLCKNSEVAARIAELRAPIVAKMQYGIEQAMCEAEDAFKVAKERGNGGAMVAAVTLRSKLNGLLVDRKEVKYGAMDDLPVDELEAMNAAIDAIRVASGTPAKGARQSTS